MATELLIERDGDRVDYLCEPMEYSSDGSLWSYVTMQPDAHNPFKASVFRYIDKPDPATVIKLKVSVSPFDFQCGISIAEARLLALALSTAADEAEAA